MRHSEAASRYAKALFELAKDSNRHQAVLSELRAVAKVLFGDSMTKEFLTSPIVTPIQKESALNEATKSANLSPETLAFLLLLARKGRLSLFEEVVEAVEKQIDASHGVVRGQARSAAVLTPEERKRIEEIVSRYTKKQVIMNYKEDTGVIGGLIAEVGSYTFDDTLASHLRRLKEEIKRRAH